MTQINAFAGKAAGVGRKAFALFWFLAFELMLVLIGPLELAFDQRLRQGAVWGIAYQTASKTSILFPQHVRVTGMIIGTLFLWWSAAHIWRNRETFFK